MVDEPHNVATSRKTGETMEIFNTKMGVQNYVIFNALRRKDEPRVAASHSGEQLQPPVGHRLCQQLLTEHMKLRYRLSWP